MKAFGKRLLGYLFFSLALAWAAGPFSGNYEFEHPGPAVYLASAGIINSASDRPGLAGQCNGPVVEAPAKALADYPEIKKALESLGSPPFGGGHLFLKDKGLAEFSRRVTGDKRRKFCLAWQDRIYFVARPLGLSGADILLAGLPGRALSDLPRVDSNDLAISLAAFDRQRRVALENLTGQGNGLRSSALEAARSMVDATGWLQITKVNNRDWGALVSGDRVFIGRVEDFSDTMVMPLTGFSWWRYVLAGIFGLAGLFLLRGRVGKLPGFKVSPGWAVRFADVIFIVFGAVGAFGFLESLMGGWFGVLPGLGNELTMQGIRVVTAWMWLPALAVFALFTANMADQSLEVTAHGITRHGPGGANFAAWEDIESLSVTDDYVPVGRVGILLARKLQTRLVIKTKEKSFSLFEPGYRKTKIGIIGAIKDNMPTGLKDDLSRIEADW